MTEHPTTTVPARGDGARRPVPHMLRAIALSVALAVPATACASTSASPGGDQIGNPADAPEVTIGGVTIGDGGAAVLDYSIADDGDVRVEIDWGDGSPVQGFTGTTGSFSNQHVYDSAATSAVVTIVATDADGNTSTATRTVDLTTPATSVSPSTTPATSPPPPTTAAPVDTTPPPPAPTTVAPPPPPPPPTTTPPPAPTTTAPVTTTTPPRSYRVTVRGDVVRVLGDCDAVGQGDFVITGAFDTEYSDPATFTIGTIANTEQLGDGDARTISSTRTVTPDVTEDTPTAWGAFFTVTEYDPVRQPDPNMNDRTAAADGLISTARSAITRTLSVGAGDCQVDMTIIVTAEFV